MERTLRIVDEASSLTGIEINAPCDEEGDGR
jgi:hypothetical protein